MPGEDTIEMMKLRAVQGELTDLPEDNPRASLSSRIRALLLKATGMPEIAHDFGALGTDKTLTLDTGENDIYTLVSDGAYLYGTLVDGMTGETKVTKIDLSDLTKVTTITLNTGENYGYSVCLDDTYLYVGCNVSPAIIVRVRLADFTRVDALTLNAGENNCYDIYVASSYLYAGLNITPSKIVRIQISDFTRVDELTLTNGGVCALTSEGSFLYAAHFLNPVKVTKIEMSSFTETAIITGTATEYRGQALTIRSGYLYVGLQMFPGDLAKIMKIDLDGFTKVGTISTGIEHLDDIVSDSNYLYATHNRNPSQIAKIELRNFTKETEIVLKTGESQANKAILDGSYIYIGLCRSPAKIVRRYVFPKNRLQDCEISRIHERTVEQSMPLAFYGKVTTYTDPTHFAISTLSRQGNDFFKNWYVYVVRDAAGLGAAPQGEDAKKITGYTSTDGSFTHLAFTANLAVDDEVLILQETLALAGAGGGDYSGDIEIWDSFEYPSNASLQSKWKETGGATSPTRSLTAFYQHYSMSIAISGVGVGEVHRAFAVPKDIGTLHNISITARSNKAAGDSFQFALYDTAGNYSYWTQTIAAQDTWETFNIDPHSSPTGDGGTPVDLDDVIELRLANLTNASTYLFDLIKFESLVASKIGIGYDGLDDAVEDSSSVRGHLLLTNEVLARTGTIYFVGIGGNDANDGKSWTNRRLTVASGYGLCSSGDTLIIGPGTFTEDINFNTDGVWVIGRGQGLNGTAIDGASTMTCGSNRFESIFFLDSAGTVVKVGNDADAQYNEFWNCRIGGGGVAIPVHIDGTAGGRYNIFDHCNIYEGSTASVLIDGGAAIGNIFRKCRIRPQTGVASHGIHVNHASTLRNTFIDCVVVGAGSTGTGIYFQLGTHNIALNCLVNDITTPYNIAANNYIVGCHEGSLIATNNTIQDDLKNNYDKIRGTPASDVIDNLNVNTEVDLIAEVTQTTVAEIDAIYVDYTGWLGDANIIAGTTLTIRVYLDDDAGALQEVGNLRDVITDGLSAGTMVKIEGLGSFERNFKVTVQSSVAPVGGAASDLVKYHFTKYDRE